MCDTFVATGDFTKSGNMIFGKNSDREPNEAQSLEVHAARQKSNSKRKATYIEVPDAESRPVLLGRPFQMFGAEMGVNDKGVVIGNEAVFTKIPKLKKNSGLNGMDMLRLALERADSTDGALEVITSLLEEFGQDGCGGYEDTSFFYHNSFLIADGKTARVLETADRFWVSKPVHGYYAISNGLTIGEDYDLSSANLADLALKAGYRKKSQPMNFAQVFSDTFYTTMGKCKIRRSLSEQKGAQSAASGFTVKDAMTVLRSHNPKHPDDPSRSGLDSLCVHAAGLLAPSQTTNSLIVEVGTKGIAQIFATGTSAPCISMFKPVAIANDNHPLLVHEENAPAGSWAIPGKHEDQSLWWQHEGLHRRVLASYAELAPLIQQDVKPYEDSWLQSKQPADAKLTEEAFAKHFELLSVWKKKIKERLPTIAPPRRPLYRMYWSKRNRVLKEAL